MTDRYGPYPIKGIALLKGPEARLAFPSAVIRYERFGDEDKGYGFDDLEKVAFVDRTWSSTEPWTDVADWHGRQLQQLGWEPLAGDEYRQPSGWPWEMTTHWYDFQRDGEEIGLNQYDHPEDLAVVKWAPALRAYMQHTWYNLVIKAWSPGHERYPGLAEQLEREKREGQGSTRSLDPTASRAPTPTTAPAASPA